MNASQVPILSLDIPSGINADTGAVLGTAVRAEATVTFGMPKRGNLLYPGYACGGDLYCSEISFPPEAVESASIAVETGAPPNLPLRDPAGHKGSFGKVLIIGGAPNYRGAPAMAASAALRSGAGYARLAVPAVLAPQIFPLVPEAVFLPMEGAGGALGAEHTPALLEHADSADSAVIGPGLSTAPESIRLAREFIAAAKLPLVIDGDALTALAGREEITRSRSADSILTPHPGEMARLLGSSIQDVESNRIEIAREAAERYGATVVFKGAHTVIAEADGSVWMNLTGNAGMGTAGSGDVLAGLIGALAARMNASAAARLGVHLHGLAGDLAAAEVGETGMTATDLLEALPAAFRRYPGSIADDPFSGRIRIC